MDIRDTLKERGDRYGAFEDHAHLCQEIKATFRIGRSWNSCSPSQKQALETIADKIARMLNGDPDYDDNWIDIIGYAQLVLDELHEHNGQTKMEFDEVEEYMAKEPRSTILDDVGVAPLAKYGDISPDGKQIWDGKRPVYLDRARGKEILADVRDRYDATNINLTGHEAGDQ
jgi:hypothetical protein